jgi:hypothetical protein
MKYFLVWKICNVEVTGTYRSKGWNENFREWSLENENFLSLGVPSKGVLQGVSSMIVVHGNPPGVFTRRGVHQRCSKVSTRGAENEISRKFEHFLFSRKMKKSVSAGVVSGFQWKWILSHSSPSGCFQLP